jgi:hypothetical protein
MRRPDSAADTGGSGKSNGAASGPAWIGVL